MTNSPQHQAQSSPDIWVTAMRVAADRRSLAVDFTLNDQPETHELSAEYLRVESPSAEVQGHGPGQKRLVSGKADITIKTMDPVGHYAVRIGFADGHASGLYTWSGLYDLAQAYKTKWAAYCAALEQAGLSR
ncbi:MAG: DUF971 domain-containing protein [Pseudomonadota bacterium]